MYYHKIVKMDRNRQMTEAYLVLDDRKHHRAILLAWWPHKQLTELDIVAEYHYTDYTDQQRALALAVDHGKGMAR